MSITANQLLDSINTESGLRDLIGQLDITASGDSTVLYSGNVAENIG